MELITILNRCHRFRGFVYHQARFTSDHKSIEIAVPPRKRSAAICSRCHHPAPGYDQLPKRRYEFIPLWGFFVFLLYAMRRVDCPLPAPGRAAFAVQLSSMENLIGIDVMLASNHRDLRPGCNVSSTI